MTTREIAHIWANNNDPLRSGRASALSFDGCTIYSYATAIGVRVARGDGDPAYILNATKYSPTTTRHQSLVRNSIRSGAPVTRVYNIPRGDKMRDYMAGDRGCRALLAMASASVRAGEIESAERAINSVISISGLLDSSLGEEMLKEANEIANSPACNALSLARGRREAAAKRGRATRAAKAVRAFMLRGDACGTFSPHSGRATAMRVGGALRELSLIGGHEKLIADFGEFMSARLDRWRRGEPARLHEIIPSMPVALRKKGDSLETSLGETVEIKDAHNAYKFIQGMRGKGWISGIGNTVQIGGNYHLRSVNESGIVAGCHTIAWAEIDRIAAELGWDRPNLESNAIALAEEFLTPEQA